MNQEEIYKEFVEAQAILQGHFILSSGLHSDTYLQCARVLMDGERAARLCAELASRVKEQVQEDFDMVVSPAMGGVVVGYEMGRQIGVPAIFCERVNGSFAIRRGFEIEKGTKVLLVEDVVTTGKSSLETVECIKANGGVVVAEASLVDRSSGNHGLPFPLISLLEIAAMSYEADALPSHLEGTDAIKPGSRHLKR